MAKTEKRRLGDIGEDLCCKFLVKRGFTVLERNYLKPWGEIDVIAEKGSNIRFVEVKTVSRETRDGSVSREMMRPEENMHEGKVKRLHRTIQIYLLERKVPEHIEWQLDLVCVYIDLERKKGRVEMLENIIIG